jgi:hypothetical protein
MANVKITCNEITKLMEADAKRRDELLKAQEQLARFEIDYISAKTKDLELKCNRYRR